MGMPAIRPEVPSPELKPPLSIDDQNRRGTADPAVTNFSIVVGGPAYDLLLRLGLLRFNLPNVLRRMTILVGLAWLPLLLFSIKDGLAWGQQARIPLLYDFATYGRLLLCLPLLLLAEIVIDPGIRMAVSQFVEAHIVEDEVVPKFDAALRRIQRLRDSKIPELILLALAFFPVFLFEHEWTAGAVSSWHTTAKGLTAAG
jgi:hypothetical protein